MLKSTYKNTILKLYKRSIETFFNTKVESRKEYEMGMQYAIERIVDELTPELNELLMKEAKKIYERYGIKWKYKISEKKQQSQNQQQYGSSMKKSSQQLKNY